ncbi:MAG: carboxypeptidase [Pseudonocardiaceae bacterium]|nr:carboxypeptidase [Pseudonocardiaceae bacterium]
MFRTRSSKLFAAAMAMLLASALGALMPASAAPAPPRNSTDYVVYRVHDAADRAAKLSSAGFDVLEHRVGDDLFVLGDRGAAGELRAAGFTPSVHKTMRVPGWQAPARGERAEPTVQDTYYGGYHTVNAHYAHLDKVAADHPDLATVETYGQSWRKATGKDGGYDLKAICITKKAEGDCQRNPDSAKPRFFLMSQTHAREIATGEISYQWIDYLVNGYGNDQAVTKLLDSTEVWVVPIHNPDGVDIVQQGGDSPELHRKNANDTHGADCGGNQSSQIGVDLNRNNDTHWGGNGTSEDPCDQTFLGPEANSEVENGSLQKLLTELYPDKREGGDGAAAPNDTRGMLVTLHSYAGMVLFPWGHDSSVKTGNDAALRSLGGELGEQLGYQSGQAGEILYDASGGHDDWIYDKLGVAAYTIELGDVDGRGCDGFLPRYSCATDYFWPQMQPALLHAAQRASAPYQS